MPTRMANSRSDGNNVAASDELAAPLLEQHQRLLDASGIHPEVAKARGYFSASASKTLQQLGFSKSQQQRVPALVIPVCGVTGDVVFHEVRPDQPRELAGKAVKYETPHGARMAIDIHPLVRHRLGDPHDALIVTEGIRKADAAVSHGVTAVALMGVWNWRGTNGDGGKAALADWELVALNDRKVFLAFDSDASAKREVRAALERLQRFLELRGATVHVAELEPGPRGTKVGLDDFLADGGDLAELLNRGPPQPARPERGDGCAGDGRTLARRRALALRAARKPDPQRYERAALRWLQRFIDERLPPLTEIALAASALAELRHGKRAVGVDALKRIVRK
jgi:hypothetical protein